MLKKGQEIGLVAQHPEYYPVETKPTKETKEADKTPAPCKKR